MAHTCAMRYMQLLVCLPFISWRSNSLRPVDVILSASRSSASSRDSRESLTCRKPTKRRFNHGAIMPNSSCTNWSSMKLLGPVLHACQQHVQDKNKLGLIFLGQTAGHAMRCDSASKRHKLLGKATHKV
jgi:hypothetical protein